MKQQIDNQDISYLREMAKLGRDNTPLYGKKFLPNRFTLPWSPLHVKIWKAIDAKVIRPDGVVIPKYRKIAVVSCRAIGKTSIAKTIVDKAIRYRLHNFILYVGKSEGFAMMQTDNIKRSILQNKLANLVFPGQDRETSGFEVSKLPKDFSKKAWMINDVLVMPRGWGQPIRGLQVDFNMFTYRPSLMVIDDLEDPKDLRSPVTRAEIQRWFFADVEKAKPLDSVNPNWQIIYIDTMKDQDSLLVHLINDPTWHVVVVPICEDDGKWESLAPDFIPNEELREDYLRHKELGRLNIFYQEMMCQYSATELKKFTDDIFRFYDETDPEFIKAKAGQFINIVLCDPAKTAQMESADTAIEVWGLDLVGRKAYLRDYDRGKWSPSQVVSNMFYWGQLYGALILGVETTGIEDWIREPMMAKQQSLGTAFQFEWLSAHTGKAKDPDYGSNSAKVRRASPMADLMYRGIIYFNKSKHKDVTEQFKAFPSPKLWDLIDCASYIQVFLNRFNMLIEDLQYQDNIAKQIQKDSGLIMTPLPPNAGAIL